MYSVNNINELPSIQTVRERAKALALVDAIIMPDWEYRYFSFNNTWNFPKKESMASMRNGSGSEYFVIFSPEGAVGKTLDIDDQREISHLLDDIPVRFSSFKNEKAFNLHNASFYFWRSATETAWVSLPASDVVYSFLGFLANGVEFYHQWAEEYYERSIDLDILRQVYDSLKISNEQLSRLNPDLSIEDLKQDLDEIVGT